MKKVNFSQYTLNVFADMNTTYEEVKNLMFDILEGNEIFDEESGRVISKKEANDKLRTVFQKLLGVDEHCTKREFRRAMEAHHREIFDVLEEAIDFRIENSGFMRSDFFNTYVDLRNIALGDEQRFKVKHDTVIHVSKVGTSHHDYALQRLAKDTYFTVPVQRYGAALGIDLNMYIIGRENLTDLVDAIASAFDYQIDSMINSAMVSAASQLPVQTGFVDTGVLGSTTKDRFDAIIENVRIANNSDVAIVGTLTALKKINALSEANTNWIANSLKESVSHTGILGDYEGTNMIVIPQRFVANNIPNKLISNTVLWIMPVGAQDKFIKFVDAGETEIDQILNKGEDYGRQDDIGKYEVQREMGCSVVLGRYFGKWTIES